MATNHEVFEHKTLDGVTFRVMKTKASNICPYVINKPISSSGELGMNGTFFSSADYTAPPESSSAVYPNGSCGRGISWALDASKVYPYNGTSTENYNRGTLVICTNNNTNKTIAEVVSKKTVEEIQNYYSGLPVTINAMIGGGTLAMGSSDSVWRQKFNDENWDSLWPSMGGVIADILDFFTPDSSLRRAGIGVKTEDGECYAYLAVSIGNASLYELKHLFEELKCAHAIFLDGSDSVQMRWKSENNVIWKDISGSTPRYIWNMIKLKDKT